MASGLPVVAPCSGGVLSYAKEDNSWLAEPSGESFAAAVREIFAYPSVRKAKIEQALRTAEEFSWTRVTARFFALYDDLHARLGGLSSFRPTYDSRESAYSLTIPSWSNPTTTRPPATTMGRRIRFGSEAIRLIASRRDGG